MYNERREGRMSEKIDVKEKRILRKKIERIRE